MKIKTQDATTISFDKQELIDFIERVRLTCSVSLGDLMALGMPMPRDGETFGMESTGRLLTTVLSNLADLQKELGVDRLIDRVMFKNDN